MGKAKAKLTPAEKAQRRLHTIKHLKQYSALYAMMILPLLYFIIFKYVPMFGNILAFRRYRPGQEKDTWRTFSNDANSFSLL